VTPVLITARLKLTDPSGFDHYLRWLTDPYVVEFSEQRFLNHTKNSQKKYFESFDGYSDHLWEIQKFDDGTPIGSISTNICWPHKRAEIGIMLGEKSEWRKGYGAEAWQGIMDWLGVNGVQKIEGGCHPLNTGMVILFAKMQMPMEAHIHDHFMDEGGIRYPLFRFGRLL
jgi:RimJ/RimL family protein N-acetyltransferase